MENLETGVCGDSASGLKFADNEFKEVKQLLDSLPEKCSADDQISLERSFERFVYVTDLYQEQSHLLDSKLPQMLEILLNYVKNHWSDEPPPILLFQSFKYLCHLTKIRGYKVILRHLPHDVTDLEPVMKLLEHESCKAVNVWETRYMLLLWLTLLCKMPFALEKFDLVKPAECKSLKHRMLDSARPFLSYMDKSRESAALFLAEFVSRPDTVDEYLKIMVLDTVTDLKRVDPADVQDGIRATGLCSLLAEIFKRTKRENLIPLVGAVLDDVFTEKLSRAANILLRKLITKLIQRAGMVFLKPQSANWRYRRSGGSRSLAKNLTVDLKLRNENLHENRSTKEEISYEINEEVEKVVNFLLQMLKDKDTIVRWSAAKGVGRITSRLPQSLAGEIVSNILTYFHPRESDGAWHGACLALAELGRRGYLLPDQLPEVVPAVIKALTYDESRGNYSVGANVRDAACYLCWSFARAFDPQELLPYVDGLAVALLTVAIFDREINCRRAASAAFQENVGRQGDIFPNGIEILTKVDYFEVGNRTHCFTELCLFIASFGKYTKLIVDHLISHKLGHWDKEIRQLTAQALGRLTKIDQKYLSTILVDIIPLCAGSDLFSKHGAILSIGQIIRGLGDLSDVSHLEILPSVLKIPTDLVKNQSLKGVGGELIRSALNSCIDDLSKSIKSINLINLASWFDIIDDNLCNLNEDIREEAAKTISTLSDHENVLASIDFVDQLIVKYCDLVENQTRNVEIQRIGASLALGSLSLKCFRSMTNLNRVIKSLLIGASISDRTKNWAESRRDCLESLRKIILAIGFLSKNDKSDNIKIDLQTFRSIIDIILQSFDDYTIDSRGDIGAIVREVALRSASTVICRATSDLEDPTVYYDESMIRSILCKILQQCCEKIDRTRQVACESMKEILLHNPQVDYIERREVLQSIFIDTQPEPRWIDGREAFPILSQLLNCPEYLYNVLLGFTVSAGGISESLAKTSTQALMSFLDEIHENQPRLELFFETLLGIFESYRKNDRVTVPLMKVLDTILTSNYLEVYTNWKNIERLLDLTITETGRSKNQQKINAGLAVCCGLMQFNDSQVARKALSHVVGVLTHPYPRTRRQAANQLYEALLAYGSLDNHNEQALSLLTETNWDSQVDKLKEIKQDIALLLKVNV